MIKKISIWGSTGSIGRQALDVIGRHRDEFEIIVLTTNRNVDVLIEQCISFHPKTVVIAGQKPSAECTGRFRSLQIEILWGKDGLLESAARGEEDVVLNALVGSVGLEATLNAIHSEVSMALANKEVLVMAGEIIMREIRERGLDLIPVDSEHSAIYQCLQGEPRNRIRRILLTASGGPFLNTPKSAFDGVTVEQALRHPNWSMGKKVSIDSATLINKGLEVMEARWLFGVTPEKIQVVIHPQSVIHSMVEFTDGSIKAQMGAADMRIPIAYALSCPDRWADDFGRMDFEKIRTLTFMEPDMDKYKGLKLAYEAIRSGGTAPAVFNAADEVAVQLFLSGVLRFSQIPTVLEETLNLHKIHSHPTIEQILEADRWARETISKDVLSKLS